MQHNASGVLTHEQYQFTQDWFGNNIPVWDSLLAQFQPRKILEIGSFEGRSTCYLIETIGQQADMTIHCIDTWSGGVEHQRLDMSAVEKRFHHNVAVAQAQVAHSVAVLPHKGFSQRVLAALMVEGHAASFDLVYVDGSHQAPDVLSDAVLAFHLLKVGGVMVFDDYLWSMEAPGQQDAYNMPKPAIDAFVNIYQRKLQVLSAPLYQLYVRKVGA